MKEIPKHLASTPTPHRCCGINLVGASRLAVSVLLSVSLVLPPGALAATATTSTAATSTTLRKQTSKSKHAATAPKKKAPTRPPVTAPGAEGQLEKLARALHDQPTPAAYEQLSQFADKETNTTIGARAALALGYYDFTRDHFPEARKWLERAKTDPILGDYSLYFEGMNDRAAGASDIALSELKLYRQKYPNGAVSDSAVEELARAALASDQPQDAVTALTSYEKTQSKPSLLLLRAEAHEKAAKLNGEKPVAAAADYLDVIYHFPLSDEARTAVDHIPFFSSSSANSFQARPSRPRSLARKPFTMRGVGRICASLYEELLPKLSGADRERATLRIAQVGVQLGGSPDTLTSLKLTDPELDAERIYTLSQMKRAVNVEKDMFANIEKLVSLYPQSPVGRASTDGCGELRMGESRSRPSFGILPEACHAISRQARRPGGAMAHRLDCIHGAPERRCGPASNSSCGNTRRLPTPWTRSTGLGRSTNAPATCLWRAPFISKPRNVSRRPTLANMRQCASIKSAHRRPSGGCCFP